MSDSVPQFKEFAPNEREFYDEYVDRNTEGTLANLEAMRPALKMYPQAYGLTRDAINEMPYVGEGVTETKPNAKFDAFYARRIADIMFSFAHRIKEVGFADDSPDEIRMQNVDLSAASDVSPEAPPPADDAAVRQSFMDGSGVTDRDVAAHGDLGDQTAIDAQHTQSRQADGEIASAEAQEIADVIAELGGEAHIGDISDDDAVDVEGGGGSHSIQTGMLYSSGSSLGGGICARNCAKLLFNAVFNGTPSRLGLSQRLQILTDYGEMTSAEIDFLIKKIKDQVDDF